MLQQMLNPQAQAHMAQMFSSLFPSGGAAGAGAGGGGGFGGVNFIPLTPGGGFTFDLGGGGGAGGGGGMMMGDYGLGNIQVSPHVALHQIQVSSKPVPFLVVSVLFRSP